MRKKIDFRWNKFLNEIRFFSPVDLQNMEYFENYFIELKYNTSCNLWLRKYSDSKYHPWGILSKIFTETFIQIGQVESGEIVYQSFVEERNIRRKITIFKFS